MERIEPSNKVDAVLGPLFKIFLVFFAILSVFYVANYSGVFVQPDWDHVDEVSVDATIEDIYYKIVFDRNQPENCADGIYVTDGTNVVSFEVLDEVYADGKCVEAQIKFKNDIYNSDYNEPVEPDKTAAPDESEKGAGEAAAPVEKQRGESVPEKGSINEEITGKVTGSDISGKAIGSDFSKSYFIFYGKVPAQKAPELGTMPLPTKERGLIAPEKEIVEEQAKTPEKIGQPAPELPAENLTNESGAGILSTLEWRAQEAANATSLLGGVAWFTGANVYDSNYLTLGYANAAGAAYYYANYSYPPTVGDGLGSVIWQVKDAGAQVNFSVPVACLKTNIQYPFFRLKA
jgi:hypothetical protein